MADLDEIMAGRSDSASEQPDQQTQPANEPQYEAQTQEPEQQQHPDGYVPIQALDAERGKGRKYKEELADVNRRFGEFQQQFTGFIQAFQGQQRPQQAQPPQEAPAIWDNPDGFVDHRVSQALQGQVDPIREAIMFNSRLTAEAYHKPEAVRAAEDAFNEAARTGQIDPREHARINSSPNPFHAAVLWHKQTSALSQIGSDPDAYRERVRAELLAEMQGQTAPFARPQPNGAPPAMPSSFAAGRSAGPRATPQWSGPKPLSEIMGGR